MAGSEAGMLVLVLVEDEPVRMLCTEVITRAGHHAVGASASTSEDVLALLERDPVDLVLLELAETGAAAGLTLLGALGRRSLPVVAITAPEDSTLRRAVLEAGAFDFLSKPVDPIELECRIRLILELQTQRARAGIAASPSSMPPRNGSPPCDPDGSDAGRVGMVADMSSRKRTEEALRMSEERLSLAIAASGLGLWDWDLDTDTAYLSPE